MPRIGNRYRLRPAQLTREAGLPDLLINVAGVHPGYVQETTLDTYHQMMDLNYFGIVHTVQAFLPAMIARGSGSIVNFSSVAGLYPALSAMPPMSLPSMLCADTRMLFAWSSSRWVCMSPSVSTGHRHSGMANENKTKPFETLEAFSSKLMSAEEVAKGVLHGMRRGQYVILPGFEELACTII